MANHEQAGKESPAIGNRAAGLDAAVLAGGLSRRFGSDKRRLTVDGEGIVARTARILREVGFPRVWIVGAGAPGVPGAAALADDVPGLGPAGGIATALSRAPRGLFAVAADMPALSPALVACVLDAWDGRSAAAAPRIGGRWEPLCALYLPPALPAIRLALDAGSRSLQNVLTAIPAQPVPVPPALAAGFANVNSPAEWDAFLGRPEPTP